MLQMIKHPARISYFDLVRRNATRGHVSDDPVTSQRRRSTRRSHLVESILPRDALPAETASYARKRSGTTACLASIRSSRFAHRVFLYGDLPRRSTPEPQLLAAITITGRSGDAPAGFEIRCQWSTSNNLVFFTFDRTRTDESIRTFADTFYECIMCVLQETFRNFLSY